MLRTTARALAQLLVFTLPFLWLVLALLALATLAAPLAAPVLAAGHNAVYVLASLSPGQEPGYASRAAWMLWLAFEPLRALGVPALAAACLLLLARTRVPRIGFICAACGVALATVASLLQAVHTAQPLHTMPWGLHWQLRGYVLNDVDVLHSLALACVVLWPVLVRVAQRTPALAWLGQRVPAQRGSAWAFAVFVFVSGLGVLWLLDYAARGSHGAGHDFRWLGLRHYQAWLLALWLYALASGLRLPMLQALAWVLSRVDLPLQHWCAAAAGPAAQGTHTARSWAWPLTFWLGLLAYYGVVAYLGNGSRPALHASITSELLRLPLYMLVGWFYYRWYGAQQPSAAGQSGWRSWRGWRGWAGRFPLRLAVAMALLSVLVAAALKLTNDGGPILIWLYSACVLGIVTLCAQRRPLLVLLLALLGIAGIYHLLLSYGAVASGSLGDRTQAMQVLHALMGQTHISQQLGTAPPVTPNDFLLRLHWFMQSAPWQGYGLGHTPWCGHAGNLGAACRGLPWQTHSDYSFPALLGVYGLPLALLALAMLAALLWRLVSPYGQRGAQAHSAVVNVQVLGQWVLAVFALVALVQAVVSVLGSLATSPMTGVTLPLLSYGASSLWVCTFFLGWGDATQN